MKNEKNHQITIVGGGITGLAAAFYLQKAKQQDNLPLSISLLEASFRLGGKIETIRQDGFTMETGPDSFLERKASGQQLAMDVGLGKELVRNRTGQAYILQKGKLHPIPPGAVMGIPTRLSPFLSTDLFSWKGKLRAAQDLLSPRRTAQEDESVGSFFRRRLGDEVVDRLIEPLLSGIYASQLDKLSLLATFPQFAAMEQQHRSLILGMRKTRPHAETGTRPGQFLTLKRGLQSLVDAVENQLTETSIRTNTTVKKVIQEDRGYRLQLREQEDFHTDSLLLTLPFPAVEKMFPTKTWPTPPNATPATSVATVLLAYEERDVSLQYDGTGFVVPRGEPTTLTACTWTDRKWPHTTPLGKVLIRCYVGRSGDETIVGASDEEIVARVRQDLEQILGLKAAPLFHRVTRWPTSMPQYGIGHTTWLQKIDDLIERNFPHLYLKGASYGGVGLPDCIDQGKKAVESLIAKLTGNK